MEKLITPNLIVTDSELVEERFFKMTAMTLEWTSVINFVERNYEKAVFFFDSDMKRKQENEQNIKRAWIDTGYETLNHESIFIALVNYTEYYTGYFIGTAKFLLNGILNKQYSRKISENFKAFMKKYNLIKAERINKDDTEDIEESTPTVDMSSDSNMILLEQYREFDEENSKQLSDVTIEIFNNLLFPGWKSIEGLDTFIKTVGRRIEQLVENGRTEYYVSNKLGSVIVNTGLLDMYGNDYFVMYRKHLKTNNYVAYKIITAKADYLDEEFTYEQIKKAIVPISFMDKDGEKDFTPRFADFDINMRCLNHILSERIHRFPEHLQKCSTEYLAQSVIQSLIQALKIQERDSSYARPIYTSGRISWLFPLRVGTHITDSPELVMVIRKNGNFYELKTILPYNDEVKDKITATSLYRKMW